MRIALRAVDALLLLSLFAAPLAWFMDPLRMAIGPLHLTVGWGWKPVLVPAGLALVRAWMASRCAGSPFAPVARKGLLSLYAAWAVLSGVEGVLAWRGAESQLPPIVVRGVDERDPDSREFVFDPDLGWRFIAGSTFRGRPVNRAGFLGPDFEARKAPGAMRVVCMGDSCTAQGTPPYSGHLAARLATKMRAEVINAGVHGYTSLQGLRLYRRVVRGWSPDVVTLFFGWNDHWLQDRSDEQRFGRAVDPAWAPLMKALHRKRFYACLAGRAGRATPGSESRTVRVSLSEYEANLSKLVAEIRADGAEAVLVTAPRASRIARVVIARNGLRDQETAHALHDAYVAATRRVAARTGAPVFDLARAFEGQDELFSDDGIHFTQAGLERAGEKLGDVVAAALEERLPD